MARIDRTKFNLEATLTSGQSFSWQREEAGNWLGWIGGEPCLVVTEKECYRVHADRLAPAAVEEYFQLTFDVSRALETFPKDEWLERAVGYAPGLRILRQEPWETLASFICSSVKQIVQIQAINQNLRRTLGSAIVPGCCRFPTYQQVGAAGEETLRRCKLGFRARHLHRTALQLEADRVDLLAWHRLPTAALKEQLLALPGVGEKIADCVLLFAYGRYEVFPIDVWVERVLKQLYFNRAGNKSPLRLRRFAQDYFGPYRGYAQQYLFHWIRTGRV